MERTIKIVSVEGVKSRKKPSKHYVYAVKVTWSDAQVNVVCRRYSEFFELQEKLKEAFPQQAGKHNPKDRIIPTLQAKKVYGIRVHVSMMKKLERVSNFIKDLMRLPPSISQCEHVLNFLKPNVQDIETARKMSIKPTKMKSKTAAKTLRARKLSKKLEISGPVFFQHYRVIADIQEQFKGCLSPRKGSIVEIIEKQENGWWFADGDGEQGWVPSSYLESEESRDEDMTTMKFSTPEEAEIYVSTRSYKAVLQDELSFDVGVHLKVMEKTLDGWWKALYNGREGMVPAMYLTKIGEDQPPISGEDAKKLTAAGARKDDIKPPPVRKQSIKGKQTKKNRISIKESIKESEKEAQMSEEHLQRLRCSMSRSPLDELDFKLEELNANEQKVKDAKSRFKPGKKASKRPATLPRKGATDDSLQQSTTGRHLSVQFPLDTALGLRRHSDTPLFDLRKQGVVDDSSKFMPVRQKQNPGDASPRQRKKGIQLHAEDGTSCDKVDGMRYSSDSPFSPLSPFSPFSHSADEFATSSTSGVFEGSSSDDESDDIYTYEDFEAQDEQGFTVEVPQVKCNHQSEEDISSSSGGDSESGYSAAESDSLTNGNETESEICLAIEDYDGAESGNELNLVKHEEVRVVRKTETGWWYVVSDHGEGWAPSNFLETVPILLPPPSFRKPPPSFQEKACYMCPIASHIPEEMCYINKEGEEDINRLIDREKYEVMYKDENGYVYVKVPEKYKWIPKTYIKEVDDNNNDDN